MPTLVLLLLVATGCGVTEGRPDYTELHVEPQTLPLRVDTYYGIAWLDPSTIALAYGDLSNVVLIDRAGREKGRVRFPERPACLARTVQALSRLPTGELGLVDSCAVAGPEVEIDHFVAVDVDTSIARDLGRASRPVFDVAWRADMTTAVYSAGDHVCATLYIRDQRERPLDLEVEIDGHRFDVGQDLDATPDRCAVGGRAGHPAYSPGGSRLAFMASPNGTMRGGPDVLDLPWTIFVWGHDGSLTRVLGGIHHPGELLWHTDGKTLLFSGEIAGRHGAWRIGEDGSGLTLIADIAAHRLALSPDGRALASILSRKGPAGDSVVTLDLASFDPQPASSP